QSMDRGVLRGARSSRRSRPVQSHEGADHHGSPRAPAAVAALHPAQRHRVVRRRGRQRERSCTDARRDLRARMIRVTEKRGPVILAAVVAIAYALWVRWLTPAGATSLFWVELSFTPGNFAEAIRGWIAPFAQTQPVPVSRSHLF